MSGKSTEGFRRFLFDNLVVRTPGEEEKYLIMNLRSFRRQVISAEEYDLLCQVADVEENGGTPDERAAACYRRLLDKKQFLTKEQCQRYDELRLEQFTKDVYAIRPLINAVTISPTYSCNFHCVYCYQRKFQDKKSVMTKSHIDQICDYIKRINQTEHAYDGITDVCFNGGESCQEANIDVINYVLDLFSHNTDCTFTIFTNGSRVREISEHVDFSRFQSAQISLDGYGDLFPEINGVSAKVSDSVLDGIHLLVEKCENIKIACVVTPTLVAHMDDFVDFLQRSIIQPYPDVKIYFNVITNFYKETVDSEFMKLEDYLDLKKKFEKAGYPENIFLNSLREALELSQLLLRNSTKKAVKEHFCNVMKNRSVMFAPDGNVYWCMCTDQQHGAIGSYMHPTSGDTDHYMECLLRSPNRMIKCKDCLLKYVCRGGCLIYAAAQGKSLSEGYCGLYENPLFWDRLEEFL